MCVEQGTFFHQPDGLIMEAASAAFHERCETLDGQQGRKMLPEHLEATM